MGLTVQDAIVEMFGRARLIALYQAIQRVSNDPMCEVVIGFSYKEEWEFPSVFVYLPSFHDSIEQFVLTKAAIDALLNLFSVGSGKAVRLTCYYVKPLSSKDFPKSSLLLSALTLTHGD